MSDRYTELMDCLARYLENKREQVTALRGRAEELMVRAKEIERGVLDLGVLVHGFEMEREERREQVPGHLERVAAQIDKAEREEQALERALRDEGDT